MINNEMTRKEFLTVAAAFLGLALLSRMPFVGGSSKKDPRTPGSYGTSAYGGKK